MTKRAQAFLGLLLSVMAGACGGPSLSPEEVALLEDLQGELELIRSEIEEADAASGQLSGGLVKALIGARLEILKTTDALIRQRIHAVEAGAEITVEVGGSEPSDDLAATLAAEIEAQEEALAAARAEASRYSGGLVLAMKQSTVASHEQTLALLRQRFLAAKYGLSMPTFDRLEASSRGDDALLAATVDTDDDLQEEILAVRLLKKEFTKQNYQEYIFFNIEFDAVGLDKPARAIKGVMRFQDLFGETKLAVNWTIDDPIQPSGKIVERGTGFEYNQFRGEHNWARSTSLDDMQAVFFVTSILYVDGDRRDF